jgi:pimeloyl-ACP methyl ester carboxylesterase
MGIPIVVLHGAEETVIPKTLVKKMAEAYTDMKLCWYEGMGHYAFYQAPEKTEYFLERYYPFL